MWKRNHQRHLYLWPIVLDLLPSQRHRGCFKSLNTHANAPYTTHLPSTAEVPQWNSLTYIKDAVPRPTPPPALELLMLCVLQAAVVENDTNYTLLKKDSNVNYMIQTPLSRWLWFSRVEAKADLLCFSPPIHEESRRVHLRDPLPRVFKFLRDPWERNTLLPSQGTSYRSDTALCSFLGFILEAL